MDPLTDNPSAFGHSICWEPFPAQLREEFRLIAWTMVNETLPNLFLQERARGWRSRISVPRMATTVQVWRALADWLQERSITTLAALTPQLLADFARAAFTSTSRNYVGSQLTALTRLWAFDHLSPQPLGVPEPPWESEGVDDYLPAASPHGENATDAIAEQTMGPLLIWALRMVDGLADDILSAWAERRRLDASINPGPGTPATGAAAAGYIEDLIAQGRPMPSTWIRGAVGVAPAYVAALTGATVPQAHYRLRKPAVLEYLARHAGPCPLEIKPAGKVDGRRWREHLDYYEIASLVRHLGTACFIVIAYLTGMRPGEVLGLRSGCCPPPRSGRHLIYGHTFKTAQDEHGHHVSAGLLREVPWVAITPVVRAIRVLEGLVPTGGLLFDHGVHGQRAAAGTGSLNTETIGQRIEDFITWANGEARRLELPEHVVPPDPHGAIGASRLRRTLAWHIARRPGGLIALAIQYGHLRTAISGNYASRSRDGIHDLLDVETALATIDTVAALNDDLDHGGGISGPAARRAIHAAAQAPRFRGVTITARTAHDVLTNPNLAVYDNPHALLMCVYKPDKALCRRDATSNTPTLDDCVGTCANIARTDHQAAQLRGRAEQLEAKARLVPGPLAERLHRSAAALRRTAEHHDTTRITTESS
ncbi:integrase [Streptomyces sp. NPDC050732]|uniref:integrase n=1 Tax=Streptomyces sp. NPDC050732 TaxID=3154632 RepID=UPI003426672D